ncbi:hypothetical protein BU16DRAFT_581773 [Lophium mytilinum]|uniref:Uncharacterized protein n=1 Tax=Lophium mytilinum TaxID=390894 RepID=A0A6A6QW53_9PEZI|nr:hypothetical protein BU16DRAFT_581773 [Lophium mytilinum]
MSIHCAPSSPSKRSGCYFADLVVSLPYNLPLEPLQNPEMSPVPLVDRTTEITFYNHLASPRTSSFLSSAAAFSPLYRQEAFKCVDAEGRVEAWTFAANVWVPIPDPDLDALVLGEWAGIVTLVAPAGKDETWEIKLLGWDEVVGGGGGVWGASE